MWSGVPYKVSFAVSPCVRRVRALVYDLKADVIGSADAWVK